MTQPEVAKHGPVIISAGGEGSRIRGFMTQELGLPEDFPKPLLPTGGPDNETLIGRIIRQASTESLVSPPIVSVTERNMAHMVAHPDIPDVVYDTSSYVFALDPMYYRLRRTGARVLGCASDFYSDFSWEDFIEQHEEKGAAMSVLVSRSDEPVQAAVFDVDPITQRITSLRRPQTSSSQDYTNVGAYILDPTPEMLDVLDRRLPANTADSQANDVIFLEIMRCGLATSVEWEGTHVNVNTPSEYQALLRHTAGAAV
jgi:NDP-sugar pyrophosphorylase family protein